MTLRLPLLVAVGLVALATTSTARPRSIEGGGSFLEAAPVEEGSYRDTILPEETSFYAVDLGVGQKLRVMARMKPEAGVERKNLLPAYPKLTLYGPDRSERSFDQDAWNVEAPSRQMKVGSRRVAAGGEWPPGTYFFTLTLGDQADTLKRREYDLEIKISVRGRAQPAPTPTLTLVTATPTPIATEGASVPPAPEPPVEGEGSPIPWFLGSFVVGGVLGAGGRLLLGRRS